MIKHSNLIIDVQLGFGKHELQILNILYYGCSLHIKLGNMLEIIVDCFEVHKLL